MLNEVVNGQGHSLHVAARCLDLIFQYLGPRHVRLGEIFVLRQFCSTDFVGND
jgi:hypothetical protein